MLKVILVLQILILLIFAVFGFYFFNQLNTLYIEVEKALVIIEEMEAYMDQVKGIVEKFNEIEVLFDSLSKISEVLSALTNPFNTEG